MLEAAQRVEYSSQRDGDARTGDHRAGARGQLGSRAVLLTDGWSGGLSRGWPLGLGWTSAHWRRPHQAWGLH